MCHRQIAIVSLQLVLKKFFEVPHVFSKIIANIENCKNNDNVITSVIQTKFWQSIEKCAVGKTILPLVIYFDDFEINNPLGLHKGISKLGAVYCTIPCLPDQYSSKLESIFLVQLHQYVDHKYLGNKVIFSRVIDMVKDLEKNGIQVNIDGEIKTIYFVLYCIAGDNLGLNTILGFTQSFNSSYCCRMCYISKEEMQKQVREKVDVIRTVENYTVHSRENTFGIKENCVFHNIPTFHIARNFSVDPMHDLLEGICRYDIGTILNNFINKNKYFTLYVLHDRIRFFNKTAFGENIPLITSDSIQKECVIISSAEMKYLILHLGLLLGDLIPLENEMWQLYILLRQIVCIAFLPAVNKENIDFLEILVSEYLSLHIKLIKKPLKFKHQFASLPTRYATLWTIKIYDVHEI